MASTTTATMVKAVVVAVLLMQCREVIVAARPLLHAAAGADGGMTMVMQVLDKGNNGPRRPGGGNCSWKKPGHPGCPPQPSYRRK